MCQIDSIRPICNLDCFFAAASSKEAAGILDCFEYTETVELRGYTIYISRGEYNIGVAVLGIAKITFALGVQLIIDYFSPKRIFSLGFAGGLGTDTHILDVVLGKYSFQYDVYSSNKSIESFKLPEYRRLSKIYAPAPLLEDIRRLLSDFGPVSIPIATGDNFLSDAELGSRLLESYGPLAADQETAALYQACLYSGIDFLAIKVITDKLAYHSYDSNAEEAGSKLTAIFKLILKYSCGYTG